MKKIALFTTLATAALLTGGVVAQDHARRQPRMQRAQGIERAERLQRAKAPRPELLRRLDLSQAQREQALAIARAAEPLVDGLRRERAREIVAHGRMRKGGPVTGEAPARPSHNLRQERREEAYQTLRPRLLALLATLTPEQRARLEARAEQHGRSFDTERAARGLAFLLSRPMAVPLLEASLLR